MRQLFSFLAGLLTGAIVGGVIALLLAPMSGEELRAQAQTRAEHTFSDIRSAVAEERRRLEEELEALKRGEIKIS
jgi:gas vesicle protein